MLVAKAGTSLPEQAPLPIARIQDVEHRAFEQSTVDSVTTASVPKSATEGWSVQIGAFPDEAAATRYLAGAKQALASKLGTMNESVEPYFTSSSSVYRARFVGFSSKSEAWAACAEMKKHDYNCWASM